LKRFIFALPNQSAQWTTCEAVQYPHRYKGGRRPKKVAGVMVIESSKNHHAAGQHPIGRFARLTPTGAIMLVSAILPIARRRLATLDAAAPVIEAAKLLSLPDIHLVVACSREGTMSGVLTKADIVRQISHCTGCGCTEGVADIMTRAVIHCMPEEDLRAVWNVMKDNTLKQMPITDAHARPLGVLYANDALQELLKEAQHEEGLLRDYVMGVGYR